MQKFFEKIEGANIETNSIDAKETSKSISREPNENLMSLDGKKMYTKVPLKEAIEMALRKLYEQDVPPLIARKTMKRLLNMAVSQIDSKCNETRYVQKNDLAMGGISCRYFGQSLAELARIFPIEGYSRNNFARKKILTEYVPSAIRRSLTGQKV